MATYMIAHSRDFRFCGCHGSDCGTYLWLPRLLEVKKGRVGRLDAFTPRKPWSSQPKYRHTLIIGWSDISAEISTKVVKLGHW